MEFEILKGWHEMETKGIVVHWIVVKQWKQTIKSHDQYQIKYSLYPRRYEIQGHKQKLQERWYEEKSVKNHDSHNSEVNEWT